MDVVFVIFAFTANKFILSLCLAHFVGQLLRECVHTHTHPLTRNTLKCKILSCDVIYAVACAPFMRESDKNLSYTFGRMVRLICTHISRRHTYTHTRRCTQFHWLHARIRFSPKKILHCVPKRHNDGVNDDAANRISYCLFFSIEFFDANKSTINFRLLEQTDRWMSALGDLWPEEVACSCLFQRWI